VIPANALEILKQWTDVHGLPLSSSMKTRVDGFAREVWVDDDGQELEGVLMERESNIPLQWSLPKRPRTEETMPEGEVLEKEGEPIYAKGSIPALTGIEATIDKALRAAGLMKG
jgi:hypothetical protein